ncbi:sensor histidine kinase [Maridesulfovibrio bastinii]|uniref:sensor histidine kinase n=1 Tax=Maridesulfovibrio bastinii TaxID=47157 RepID=UPI00041BA2EB|nr:CHASE sensor domain-containing protein [Maridesulfovibrio bastinii]
MKIFKASIGRKITAAIFGTALFALLVSMILSILLLFISYRQDNINKAKMLADLVANSVSPALDFKDPEAAEEVLGSLGIVPHVKSAVVFTSNKKVFASFGHRQEKPIRFESAVKIGLYDFRIIKTITSQGENLGWLVINADFMDQNSWLVHTIGVSFLILLVVSASSYLLASYFRKKIADPIGQLTETVKEISSRKDYSQRVNYISDDEIGLLVAEFNLMFERVQERDDWLIKHREMLELMVANRTREVRNKHKELEKKNAQLELQIKERKTAEMIRDEVERINRHDLKSSLNLVIGYPELMLTKGGMTAEQEKYIKRIAAAGYRMLDMIQSHLDMFKMEQGIYSLKLAGIDLVELLCSLEEEMALLLRREQTFMKITLNGSDVDGTEFVEILGEHMLMRTMFRNLIKNAIEASLPDHPVLVNITRSHFITVAISNCKPVPNEIRSRFFQKYVTHGKEDGSGLGTYSAMLIAKTHNLDISMATSESDGTVITIQFPSC